MTTAMRCYAMRIGGWRDLMYLLPNPLPRGYWYFEGDGGRCGTCLPAGASKALSVIAGGEPIRHTHCISY